MSWFRAAAALLTLIAMGGPAMAQIGSREHALSLYQHGDVSGALAEVEKVLERAPEDQNALLNSAQFNFDLKNLDAARGRAERLVRLTGNSATAWQLMVWIAQAQDDLKRRDEALARLKISIRSAIDPEVRRQNMLIRDRIQAGTEVVVAADYYERTGNDFTRYQFTTFDPVRNPEIGLLLRTDSSTTETWAAIALLPPDTQLFHLDLVEWKSRGEENVSIYQYYVGEPDYDTVRAKVMEILRGEAAPLSGTPGSMAGILKP